MGKNIIVSNIEMDKEGKTKVKEAKKIKPVSAKEEKNVTLLNGQSTHLGEGVMITNEPTRTKTEQTEDKEK